MLLTSCGTALKQCGTSGYGGASPDDGRSVPGLTTVAGLYARDGIDLPPAGREAQPRTVPCACECAAR